MMLRSVEEYASEVILLSGNKKTIVINVGAPSSGVEYGDTLMMHFDSSYCFTDTVA